jgi:hypothetical protein
MTKKTTAKTGKRPQLQASVDPALFERINAEAAANFDSVSAIVEARLTASYADKVRLPKTAFADTREKSAAADLEIKEMRLKQLRKELIHVDDAVKVVEECFASMKTEGITLMDEFASEFDLDPEILRRRFLLTMSGPFAVQREPYQKLADEFSEKPFP